MLTQEDLVNIHNGSYTYNPENHTLTENQDSPITKSRIAMPITRIPNRPVSNTLKVVEINKK